MAIMPEKTAHRSKRKIGIKKEGKGLTLAFFMFQIVYPVVCHFDFFLDDFLFFFNMIGALHKVIMLVYPFFKLFKTICEECLSFAVAEICAGENADKSQHRHNDSKYIEAHTIYLLY